MGSQTIPQPARAPLAPKRAEDTKFSMVSSLQRIPTEGLRFTGFRLAEIVGDGSG